MVFFMIFVFTSLISFELNASLIAFLSVPVNTTGEELCRRLRQDVKCSIPVISSLHSSGTK